MNEDFCARWYLCYKLIDIFSKPKLVAVAHLVPKFVFTLLEMTSHPVVSFFSSIYQAKRKPNGGRT